MRGPLAYALGIAALVIALSACAPAAPDPTPTPTAAFGTEEEAFAAAEATYRAYVDALNARRADPSALPDPMDFLIGDALEAEIDTHQLLTQSHVMIVGPSRLASFHGESTSSEYTEVVAVVCLDSTEARVIDESGADVTPADREPTIALESTFLKTDSELLISKSAVAEGKQC
ncbi:hypothetical protein [Microbacterium allomyrinae]|uniref:Nuclear transport factor 2 family protein n=1 Tax=Microbacterium allomyrinae TaxID=2830666 RepID=A0A9X1S3G0_9MICO|nr:hypothetical protein [Microbacterium allomyrinae]MCC2031950.1 hypothetical protein [Microbacterium allomyrinae]